MSGEGGEDTRDDPQPGHDSLNRESHPQAAGPDGLTGDMGLSSERTGPFDGIEGTGSLRSAQTSTDGESAPVVPGAPDAVAPGAVPADELNKPDQSAAVSDVDRTVGEVQPDPVEHGHDFDPGRNPRH
ncbi:MAG: hypothetical protein WB441_16865 [Nocardioidaceae bacterium]